MSWKRSPLLVAAAVTLATAAASAPKPSSPPAAQTSPARQRMSEASCRQAVQRFYDWYVPRMLREVRVSARDQALMTQPRSFSSELRRRLAEDAAAAAKSPNEIVGLDFDPFTNSQDPASHYVAKKAYRAGKGVRVEVHSVYDGKVSQGPSVIPELVPSRGHWAFVNFHYPAQEDAPATDLLQVLQQLREERRKPVKRGRP